jgi:hypothetical protein
MVQDKTAPASAGLADNGGPANAGTARHDGTMRGTGRPVKPNQGISLPPRGPQSVVGMAKNDEISLFVKHFFIAASECGNALPA